MRMRSFWLVIALLLIPTIASADGHRAGLGGISFSRGSLLVGFHAIGEVVAKDPAIGTVSVQGDVSAHFGDGVKRTTIAVAAHVTPGVSRQSILSATKKQVFGLHVLAAVVNDDGTEPAIGAGASYDFLWRSNAKSRLNIFRLQLDGFVPSGDAKNFWRASALFGQRF